MHAMPWHMVLMWLGFALLVAAAAMIVFVMTRRATTAGLPVAELGAARWLRLKAPTFGSSESDISPIKAIDTVFVLPDISSYTRFMTGSQFSFAHAQHIIFSLINAMIAATRGRIELSKLEGDAALFFVEAGKFEAEELGEIITEIFRAFFRERRRLKESNICPCRACSHIDDLDLKIFVHRGEAAWFQFKGSTDLFGTEVIVLHRIMKNGVAHKRYAMVTDAASRSVTLPFAGTPRNVEEDVEHVGQIGASVFEIEDHLAERFSEQKTRRDVSATSVVKDTLLKLAANGRSFWQYMATRPRRRQQTG